MATLVSWCRPRTGAAQSSSADGSRSLGPPVSPYGERSPYEKSVREAAQTSTRESSWTFTPLGESLGTITPSPLHFERHHGGIPNIDPQHHQLMIHGMVDRPLMLTMDEIKRLPSLSRIYFIECSGNGLTEWKQPTGAGVQVTHGLTSCSEWTGVPLSLLLREAGMQKVATWVLAEGADAPLLTRSIPIQKAMDDVLVAYGQNGEPLRPAQGYPLRLVIPGWEGSCNVKWLRRLKLVDEPYMTREETSKYTDLMPDGKSREFTFTMEAKSVITRPSGGQHLSGPGFYEISGLAWSGRGAITKVEISTDGGRTWSTASLQQPVLRIAHTRFRSPWTWNGTPAVLQSRCMDETGYVQPSLSELVAVRGLNSYYHNNAIQSWRVAEDGTIANVHA